MSPRSASNAARGFTLTELLVTIAALIVVLTLSAQLLFATRNASDRQRLQTEPRQIARGATDYVSFMIRTATDFNRINGARNPLAVMTWYLKGNPNPVMTQASYNNLTAAQAAAGLGDEGTDIITVSHADRAAFIPNLTWQGNQHTTFAYWQFNEGCPDSARNLELFKELTCGDKDCSQSGPIILADADGATSFYQITDYEESENTDNCAEKSALTDSNGVGCTANQGCIAVVANPGNSDMLNPPSGQPSLAQPITMMGGTRFVSLRVRNHWLEQKFGLFDASTDNPGTAFQPLLPNLEDFQVAWIFTNGETRNSAVSTRLTTTGGVPLQGGTPPTTYDAANVIGMRATLTAISAVNRTDLAGDANRRAIPGEVNNRYFRPEAEDHLAATVRDKVFRTQLSATSMIRNRFVGR